MGVHPSQVGNPLANDRDTGGSNRSTAAATGLYGLKPTNGTIDGAGILPTAPSFDTVGPLAGSAEIARLVHFALMGRTA